MIGDIICFLVLCTDAVKRSSFSLLRPGDIIYFLVFIISFRSWLILEIHFVEWWFSAVHCLMMNQCSFFCRKDGFMAFIVLWGITSLSLSCISSYYFVLLTDFGPALVLRLCLSYASCWQWSSARLLVLPIVFYNFCITSLTWCDILLRKCEVRISFTAHRSLNNSVTGSTT